MRHSHTVHVCGVTPDHQARYGEGVIDGAMQEWSVLLSQCKVSQSYQSYRFHPTQLPDGLLHLRAGDATQQVDDGTDVPLSAGGWETSGRFREGRQVNERGRYYSHSRAILWFKSVFEQPPMD